MIDVSDQVLVIIGGTSGLGLSASQAWVAAGGCVLAVGLQPDQTMAQAAVADAIASRGGDADRVAVVFADAMQSNTAADAIAQAIARFGRFDALYHVAGGSGRSFGDGPLHEVTDEAIDKTLRLNLHSLILSNRAAVRAFLDRGTPGAVLNMGSVLGFRPSPRYFASHIYAAAKAAIVGFTRSCAACYAPHDIRFNVVAPGLVATPMATRAAASDEILSFISSKQPLDGGRIAKPQDFDDAALYLLSNASRFVTGQVLSVDGGWSVSEGQYPAHTQERPAQ